MQLDAVGVSPKMASNPGGSAEANCPENPATITQTAKAPRIPRTAVSLLIGEFPQCAAWPRELECRLGCAAQIRGQGPWTVLRIVQVRCPFDFELEVSFRVDCSLHSPSILGRAFVGRN